MADALGRLDADVIALQECPSFADTHRLAQSLGMTCSWGSAGWTGNETWVGGFPGAILSRLPCSDVRDERAARPMPEGAFVRHWLSVLVSTSWGPLRVHGYHLCASWDRDREDDRLREIALVLDATAADRAAGVAQVLLGDHNAQPGAPCLQQLEAAGYRDAFATSGTGSGATSTSIEPRWRIDYAFVHGWAAQRLSTCRACSEAPFGADPARGGLALSDHLPVVIDIG